MHPIVAKKRHNIPKLNRNIENKSFMDWDDLKIFLAVARQGSVRSAAAKLGVHHSTVSRRIEAFERKHQVKLFDRLPSGYAIATTGAELLTVAIEIEDKINEIERHILGKDKRLTGNIRLTMPDGLINLLMPDLVAFMNQYPEVEIELIVSYEMFNITKREADIAIRITENPPEHLIGHKLIRYACSTYASLEYFDRHDPINNRDRVKWIGWDETIPYPEWVRKSDFPNAAIRGRFNNSLAQLAAVKAGLGIAKLPCPIADTESSLRRVPPGIAEPCQDIWILTHKDLASSARIKAFMSFIRTAFEAKKDLFEGRCPQKN